ncbi:uncharacterized protein LOC134195334 [Corticium candelabrum]|uniref:uncharacterized protein LOC134195334 n=1 Tax=Corticium candelabrum TaxID=121492 RepID=UPI002E255BCD|nr:uncharacterized protein LOC134195334 [Corticium candelabrum]
MDRHCDTRKASPYQQQMAVFQARNVSSSKIGTAILVANARSDRQLEEKIRSLEKVKDMEMRRLNWEQNQLRRSPNLRRHEMGSRCSLDSRSATRLDAIATPTLHRRRETFHVEPHSITCLSHHSPELSYSRRVRSNPSKRPDTPRPRALNVLLPDLGLRSMPNLTGIDEVEDVILSPTTPQALPKKLREKRNSQMTLAAHRQENSLKSKSGSSLYHLESPTSQPNHFSERFKHHTLPSLNSSSLVVQHNKPLSRSWAQLSRTENSS